MVEFPVGNAEYVRQFLLQYSLLRRKEGFVLRHDSLSAGVDQGSGFSFVPERGYNVSGAFLSKQIGADFSSNGAYSKPGQAKLLQSGSTDGTDQGEPSAAPAKPPKSNAAAQRERTGKLKMSDLAQHFHLPINAAAKELGICPTVLKKICRRNGMRRWPHRKIKSIERIIATLEQTIAEGAGQGDEGIRMEIAMLRNERAQLCAGLLGQN
ncbi:protein NLP1 [Selaginella moellendorffii]|uniref:protein NLP1 n=1 Tax=Selaginella moellendorffii TaxID=88036 RepID=UPI000D1C4E05|nr:protein NLP1 [Selaginella moellendorffii]|eukprot:XP_002983687.2 protein NLP1 [Selaginella moellendorffii]